MKLTLFLFSFLLVNVIDAQNQLSSDEVNSFLQEVLSAHNAYRSAHRVGNVQLNPFLNDLAQKEAERSLRLKHFDYNPDLVYQGQMLGRNSATGWSTFTKKYTGFDLTDLLYKPSRKYNYSINTSQNCETFTQLVWKDTREIGVGIAGKSDEIYMIVVYYPSGNVIGSFTSNVLPPSN